MSEFVLGSCLAFGAIAGVLAGLFGIGGGLVLVPFLVALFRLQGFADTSLVLMAVATSLATINITALSAIWAHHRHGNIVWPLVAKLTPGMLLGALAGTRLADALPSAVLRGLFAVFMTYVALQMALQSAPKAERRQPGNILLALAGGLIGVLSAVLGIGGGTLTVPLLVKCGTTMRNAVAVSSACGLPIALAGTAGYAWLGLQKTGLPPGSLGYVYMPAFFAIAASSVCFAPFGAKLATRWPTARLKRYFSVLLLLTALKLAWM